MRRALVTGAAGFIGAHVVRALVEDGWAVRALHLPGDDLRNLAAVDEQPRSGVASRSGIDFERVPGDVTDPDSVRRAVRGCERVFHLLYDWGERTGLAVKTTAAPAYRRVVLQREAARREPGRRRRPRPLAVNDGKGFVFVSHTGDVYPSGFLPLTTANVRESRLADVYRTSRLFRALRDEWRLGGKCGICPFQSLCGGSRARAFATTGDFLAADPACAYRPPAPSS